MLHKSFINSINSSGPNIIEIGKLVSSNPMLLSPISADGNHLLACELLQLIVLLV